MSGRRDGEYWLEGQPVRPFERDREQERAQANQLLRSRGHWLKEVARSLVVGVAIGIAVPALADEPVTVSVVLAMAGIVFAASALGTIVAALSDNRPSRLVRSFVYGFVGGYLLHTFGSQDDSTAKALTFALIAALLTTGLSFIVDEARLRRGRRSADPEAKRSRIA